MKSSYTKEFRFIIYIFLWFLLYVIAGGNTENADFQNYISHYEISGDILNLDFLSTPGFYFINKFFNTIAISFYSYRLIVYCVIFSFFSYQIWKKSKFPIAFIFLYIITSYFADIIQLKNFIAFAFLLYGIFQLVRQNNNNNNRGKLIFFICNICATSIHIAFIFYFIFLFTDISKKIKPNIIIAGSIFLSVFGFSIFQSISSYSLIYESAYLSNRVDSYMEDSSIWSVILCSFQYILFYLVNKRFIIHLEKNGKFDIDSEKYMQIVILTSVLIVFTSINMTFFRLFRNILFVANFFILNGYYYKRYHIQRRANRNNDIMFLLIYYASMSFFNFFWTDVFINTSIIFKNNLFW